MLVYTSAMRLFVLLFRVQLRVVCSLPLFYMCSAVWRLQLSTFFLF